MFTMLVLKDETDREGKEAVQDQKIWSQIWIKSIPNKGESHEMHSTVVCIRQCFQYVSSTLCQNFFKYP